MTRFDLSNTFLRDSETNVYQVENVMDIFYEANVTNGLFHEKWTLEDGAPWGGKYFHLLDHSKPH